MMVRLALPARIAVGLACACMLLAVEPVPTTVFDGAANAQSATGATVAVHMRLLRWEFDSHHLQRLPLRGFYVAHLLNGEVVTTIGGLTKVRRGGDFWSVGNGERMEVAVRSEDAFVETFAASR